MRLCMAPAAGIEPYVDEIDALRNEALQLLASIRRPLSPLKELHIRHRAGWLIVLADRLERDGAVVMTDQPTLAHVVASPATAEVLNLTPRLMAAQKNRRRQSNEGAKPLCGFAARGDQ
jgi:hypothetical protein